VVGIAKKEAVQAKQKSEVMVEQFLLSNKVQGCRKFAL